MARDVESGGRVRAKARAAVTLSLYVALVVGIGLAGWYGWTMMVLPLAPLIDPASPRASAGSRRDGGRDASRRRGEEGQWVHSSKLGSRQQRYKEA